MAKKKIGILISGGGTTMREVILACNDGRINAEVGVIIASRYDAGGIKKAQEEKVEPSKILVVRRKDCSSAEKFGEALTAACESRHIDVVGQCGWLARTPDNFINRYVGRIFNQHPGPLDGPRPAFGGPGMYGLRVHQAVLNFIQLAGVKNFHTHATVHEVVPGEYDSGPIIDRVGILVDPGDNAGSLQKRLLPFEHKLVIGTFQHFAACGRFPTMELGKPLIPSCCHDILKRAKEEAIAAFPNG